MKKLFFIIFLLFFILPSYALDLDDISAPKDYAYRLGTGDLPEKRFSVIEAEKKAKLEAETILKQKEAYLSQISYADTTLKKISDELYKELKLYDEDILTDLRLLWVGAASKSETIKFAIYKLSNSDEDKPKNATIKKIIQPIVSVTSLASLGFGDPITSTSAMIGSNLLSAFSYDNKDLNYKYTKVTDADMVVLMSRIDDLQNRILIAYTNYMSARGALEMAYKIKAKRYNETLNIDEKSDAEILIIDAYYRESQNNYERHKAEFDTRRAELEQLVGTETLLNFEKYLNERISANNSAE